jgi:predicted PurR-regulated permease PerM
VFIILILSYYLTLDGHRLGAALLAALPMAYRDDARYFFASVNRAFGGFMRGQLTQALIYALGTAAVMSLAGLQLVLLSSVAALVFMLIPFVGPFLALALPLIVSLATAPEVFWAVLLVLFILQQIVVNVIAPRLMSQTIGMHPLLVFLAVLGGAKVAGVWGAIFGVPILGVASTMVSFYRATVGDRQKRLEVAVSQLPREQRRSAAEEPEALVDLAGSIANENVADLGTALPGSAASNPQVQREPRYS